jgi:hypothetical protein
MWLKVSKTMTPIAPTSSAYDTTERAAPVQWRGESGRFYTLAGEDIENFTLNPDDLYLVAEDGQARWIGTAADIVSDIASRSRFRAALKRASSVLRLSAPSDEVERMRMAYDIEHGGLAESGLSLVS